MDAVETRICRVCEVERPIDAFPLDRGRRRHRCRTCIYLSKKASVDAWRKAHPGRRDELARESRKRRDREWRAKAIAHLGSVCVSCGIDDVRVLQLDHVNGGGHDERLTKDRVTFYREVALGTRDDVQLLCANCHLLKPYRS